MIVRHSALVERPAAQMFDLIEAAEHYPDFLPWCAAATILQRDDNVVAATIRVDFHGVGFSFATRNPKRRPDWMAIHLEHGPFRRFEGEWQLRALTDWGCKVGFALDYEFDSELMTRLAGPVFGRIAGTLMDAFVQRALALPAAAPDAAPPGGATPSVPPA
jgi:ribosome-associated toxin RatA of RatAB toxin-antitoxin module